MKKIKVGVFGAARGMTMIHQLERSKDAELVAVCDKYKPLLDECKKLSDANGLNVALFENFEDFFNCDMDAVILANYAHEHAPFAIRLLNSGRHVMSEVLTCATLDEGLRLCEAVEKSGKIYNYAENYCYFNTTFEMRKLYREGAIGELMHAEGEYIHDCSSIWPSITYGERDHWRNRMYSTFYNTHSLGPILFSTGLRPKNVVGFESSDVKYMRDLGYGGGIAAIELVQLTNGATVKSIHGDLRREPGSINYEMYCENGCMETDRWDANKLHVYQQTERNCVGDHKAYNPEFVLEGAENAGHGGSDFFTTYYFIRSILGDENAIGNTIDVYSALDMCTTGILAYKSILAGNKRMDSIDFRDKAAREVCRGDTFCTFASSAGDMIVPNNSRGEPVIPDEVYAKVRKLWLNGENG